MENTILTGKFKNMNLEKFKALQEVDSLLDSPDVTYMKSDDKSLLDCSPDSTWKLHRIHSWLRSVLICISIEKKIAYQNQPRITTFLQNK